MNGRATALLAEAKGFLARGEEFYRKAAEKMRAAKDEGATWAEIGEALGHSKSWAERIVSWHETPANSASRTAPFTEPTGVQAKRHAKVVLRDLPAEEIAETLLADPVVRAKVTRATRIAAHDDDERRTLRPADEANRAFRENVGPEVADDLEASQLLRDAEHELVRARGALAGFLKLANTIEGERPGLWVDHCRDWLDDLTEKVELARGLLDGSNVDDAINQILAGEV
jgi:hypothetical protein